MAGLPLWKRPRARRIALTLLLWAGMLAVLWAARRVLLPFVIAALLAYVLNPLISWLAQQRVKGRQVPRWTAVVGVYLVFGLMFWAVGVSLVPTIYREAIRGLSELRDFLAGLTPEQLTEWGRSAEATLNRWNLPLDVLSGDADSTVDLSALITEAMQHASATLKSHVGDVVTFSRAIVTGMLRGLFFTLLLLMITAFISIDAPRIVQFLESLVPGEWRADFDRLLNLIDAGLAGVVRGQITICLINGLLTLIGLLILKIPFPYALAALATVLTLVPIFGTILSSIPIVLLGLTRGLHLGILALAWILAIHALEAYILNPKIMGSASRIHPVLIVLALLIGERTAGIAGALLAVPIASIVAAIFKFLHRRAVELEAAATAEPAPDL
jgi:predicted PurR-regulated permease PerM